MLPILHTLSAGRVLDVATGRGGFADYIVQNVKDYTELVGIDSVERNETAFQQTFANQPKISFRCMDAAHLDFADASFDTVCMASSLHHMTDPRAVLAEIDRVLKPGGCCILTEMYSDDQSETQFTHVLLHHWWAAVDAAEGVCHRETYNRAALIEMLQTLPMTWQFEDYRDLEEDPLEEEGIGQLDGIIEAYQNRAANLPDAIELQRRGDELRRRLHEIGVHGATQLVAVGQKIGA